MYSGQPFAILRCFYPLAHFFFGIYFPTETFPSIVSHCPDTFHLQACTAQKTPVWLTAGQRRILSKTKRTSIFYIICGQGFFTFWKVLTRNERNIYLIGRPLNIAFSVTPTCKWRISAKSIVTMANMKCPY